MNDDQDTVLARFPRGMNAEIRVAVTSFKGVTRIDLRTHFRNEVGDFRPTRKGATFTTEEVGDVIEALQQAMQHRSVASATLQPKPAKANVSAIAELRQKGMSCKAIAEKLGYDRTTVYRHLKAQGLLSPSNTETDQPPDTP